MTLVLTLLISAAFSAIQILVVVETMGARARWGLWLLGILVSAVLSTALSIWMCADLGIVHGIAFAVFCGIGLGTPLGVLSGMDKNTTTDLAAIVALGVSFPLGANFLGGILGSVPFGAVFGVIAGAVAGVVTGTLISLEMGLTVGVMGGMAVGVLISMASLRAVFYVFQIGPALWQTLRPGSPSHRLIHHPALEDELAILPFPGLAELLAAALQEDFRVGLDAIRHLLRNTFQRWVVARGFARFSAEARDPLGAVYQALLNQLLDEYPVEPMADWQLRYWPPIRALWLGDLGWAFVDTTAGLFRTLERLVWRVTHNLWGPLYSRIDHFAFLLLLLHLLDEDRGIQDKWHRALCEEVHGAVESVRALPHGEEIALSLETLVQFSQMNTLEDIVNARRQVGWLESLREHPLRPQILEVLRGLEDVTTELARFRHATSPNIQAIAINRAVGMLNQLSGYVEGINLPERGLLRLVVGRWQSLVAEAAGRLGEQALRDMTPYIQRSLPGGDRKAALWLRPANPFANPYKAGDPVYPPLFVGRGDVFDHIQEVWGSKANPDSVILYGHRRMGKSSILRNLGEYAPAGSLLVYADLKGEAAFAEGTHHLLRGLADAVAWAAQEQGLEVAEPNPADFATPSAAAPSFRRLLRRAQAALPENASLIMALDEFEAVDDGVKSGKIGPEIYDYLRSLSQEPHIVLVFAGLHTLDEMSRSYQAAFFGSYVNIHVSYLSQEAAERLITRPTLDFALNYHRAVVSRIIHETHGQPLLVQRICQELVNQVNHEMFDLEKEREARVLPEDLEAVLSDEFVQSETRYFEGIRNDQIAGRAEVEAVLGVLAAGKAKAGDIAQMTGIPAAEITDALDYLKTRDLVATDPAGNWDLVVPLMRRWLRLRMKQG